MITKYDFLWLLFSLPFPSSCSNFGFLFPVRKKTRQICEAGEGDREKWAAGFIHTFQLLKARVYILLLQAPYLQCLMSWEKICFRVWTCSDFVIFVLCSKLSWGITLTGFIRVSIYLKGNVTRHHSIFGTPIFISYFLIFYYLYFWILLLLLLQFEADVNTWSSSPLHSWLLTWRQM